VRVYSVCDALCVGRGGSPIQGDLPIVYRIKKHKKRPKPKRQTKDKLIIIIIIIIIITTTIIIITINQIRLLSLNHEKQKKSIS
jgi:hypothetical protein